MKTRGKHRFGLNQFYLYLPRYAVGNVKKLTKWEVHDVWRPREGGEEKREGRGKGGREGGREKGMWCGGVRAVDRYGDGGEGEWYVTVLTG